MERSPCERCENKKICKNEKRCKKWVKWFKDSWQEVTKPFRDLRKNGQKEKAALTAGADKAVTKWTINNYSINEKKGESQDV